MHKIKIIAAICEHVAQNIRAKHSVDRLYQVDSVNDSFVKPWFVGERGIVYIYVYQHTRSAKHRPGQIRRGQTELHSQRTI